VIATSFSLVFDIRVPTLSELFGFRSGLALRVFSYVLPHGGQVEHTLLLSLGQSKYGVRVR